MSTGGYRVCVWCGCVDVCVRGCGCVCAVCVHSSGIWLIVLWGGFTRGSKPNPDFSIRPRLLSSRSWQLLCCCCRSLVLLLCILCALTRTPYARVLCMGTWLYGLRVHGCMVCVCMGVCMHLHVARVWCVRRHKRVADSGVACLWRTRSVASGRGP